MLEDSKENTLYVKALRELQRAGKQPEHHKTAETPREVDFMRDAQTVVTRSALMIPYAPNQYETIFQRGSTKQ